MDLEWAVIKDFPKYAVSTYGDILNEDTGRILRPNKTPQGHLKVGLTVGGIQHTRSVKVLVAEAFISGRDEIYDTAIQLDGNPDNNRADNLVWRPRWFALEYLKQLDSVSENDHLGPVVDLNNGEVYADVYEVGIMNGLLFRDVRRSILMKESVFPTIQRFAFL